MSNGEKAKQERRAELHSKLRQCALELALADVEFCEEPWTDPPFAYRTAILISIRRASDHIDIAVFDGIGAMVGADQLLAAVERIPCPQPIRTSKPEEKP